VLKKAEDEVIQIDRPIPTTAAEMPFYVKGIIFLYWLTLCTMEILTPTFWALVLKVRK
jgi:hypothetical protein